MICYVYGALYYNARGSSYVRTPSTANPRKAQAGAEKIATAAEALEKQYLTIASPLPQVPSIPQIPLTTTVLSLSNLTAFLSLLSFLQSSSPSHR